MSPFSSNHIFYNSIMAREDPKEIPVRSRESSIGDEAMAAMNRPMDRPLWMPFGSSSPPLTLQMNMKKPMMKKPKKNADFQPQDMLTMD